MQLAYDLWQAEQRAGDLNVTRPAAPGAALRSEAQKCASAIRREGGMNRFSKKHRRQSAGAGAAGLPAGLE